MIVMGILLIMVFPLIFYFIFGVAIDNGFATGALNRKLFSRYFLKLLIISSLSIVIGLAVLILGLKDYYSLVSSL